MTENATNPLSPTKEKKCRRYGISFWLSLSILILLGGLTAYCWFGAKNTAWTIMSAITTILVCWHLTTGHIRTRRQEIVVHAYPSLIFIWPLIFLGFLFYPLSHWGVNLETEAWIYAVALTVVVLTLGVTDLNRNITVFWIVVVAFFWVGILYLRDVKNVVIFSNIASWIKSLDPAWSPDFGLASAIPMSILYLIILAKARLNDRWIFGVNRIEHLSFGKSDKVLTGLAKTTKSTYPSSLKQFLLLAGTIEVMDARGTGVLAIITNVPFVEWRVSKINHILRTMVVAPTGEEEMDGHSGDDEHHGEENSGSTGREES